MAAAQKPNPFTGFSPSGGLSQRRALFLLLASAFALFLASTIIAWRQEPRPNPLQPITTLSLDWWKYPCEQNAFKRLPVVTSNLNAVFTLPGTDKVWAVSDTDMIVHSDDGGRTWGQQKVSPNAEQPQEQPFQKEPEKAAGFTLPDLLASAHANGEPKPSSKKQPDSQPTEKTYPTAKEPIAPVPAIPTPRPAALLAQAVQASDLARMLQTFEVAPALSSITMLPDGRQGWIVGGNGTILHTADGGQTWMSQGIGAAVPGQLAGETSSGPIESSEESEVTDLQCVGRTDAGAAS